jgi:hypothetical protein
MNSEEIKASIDDSVHYLQNNVWNKSTEYWCCLYLRDEEYVREPSLKIYNRAKRDNNLYNPKNERLLKSFADDAKNTLKHSKVTFSRQELDMFEKM